MEIEGYIPSHNLHAFRKDYLMKKWVKTVYKVINYDYSNGNKEEIIQEYIKTYEEINNELKNISNNYVKDYSDFRLDCYSSLLFILQNK